MSVTTLSSPPEYKTLDYGDLNQTERSMQELRDTSMTLLTISAMVATAAPPAPASASLASAPTTQQPGGKGTGGGGKSGGRGGGKGKGGGNRPQIPGPGPPGSFWHYDRQIFVRFVDDPATGRRDNRVCFLCGCGSTPGSKFHRADYCPHKDTPAQHDWVERAIASK